MYILDTNAAKYLNQYVEYQCLLFCRKYLFITIYGTINNAIINPQNIMFIVWSCQNDTKLTTAIIEIIIFYLPPKGTYKYLINQWLNPRCHILQNP